MFDQLMLCETHLLLLSLKLCEMLNKNLILLKQNKLNFIEGRCWQAHLGGGN